MLFWFDAKGVKVFYNRLVVKQMIIILKYIMTLIYKYVKYIVRIGGFFEYPHRLAVKQKIINRINLLNI